MTTKINRFFYLAFVTVFLFLSLNPVEAFVNVAGTWSVYDGEFRGTSIRVHQAKNGKIIGMSGDAYSRIWGWDEPTAWERCETHWVADANGVAFWNSRFFGRYGWGPVSVWGPVIGTGSVELTDLTEQYCTFAAHFPPEFGRFSEFGGPVVRTSWAELEDIPPGMEDILISVAAVPPANIIPTKGLIQFQARAQSPCDIDFYVKDPSGVVLYLGRRSTTSINNENIAAIFWNGLWGSQGPSLPGFYTISAQRGSEEKTAAFEVLPIPSNEVLTVSATPGTLWIDSSGAGSGIVFRATTKEAGKVTLSVRTPAGQVIDIAEKSTVQNGSEHAVKFSWWGFNVTMSGPYSIIAEVDSSSKEASFTVEKTEQTVTGMGSWMKNSKDPTAQLPPKPRGKDCQAVSWEQAIGQKEGYTLGLTLSDPVNVAFGNFFLPEIDLSLKARAPIVLARIYNSLEPQTGIFGRGWSSPFTTHLEFLATDVVFINSDGSRVLFQKTEDAYLPPSWCDLRLSYDDATNLWSLSHPHGSVWSFNAMGKIIRIAHTCCGGGATDGLLFDYDEENRLVKVDNSTGQFILFAYNNQNLVASITDFAGRGFQYAYDESGNLLQVINPIDQITAYQYNEDNLINKITRPGNRISTISYEGLKVTQVVEPSGAVVDFVWDNTNHKLTFQDLNGTVHEYLFSPKWELLTYKMPDLGIVKEIISSGTAVTGISDSMGNHTRYAYDEKGLVQSETDPLGNKTTYEWHPTFHQLAKKTDPLGRAWQYIRCQRGNLWSEIDPAGGVTSYTYDAHNNRTSKTDPLGRVQRWVYDSMGNYLIQAIDPEGGISSFSYDNRGNLVSSSDPLGRTTTFQYDILDRLTKTVYADGRFVEIEYDEAGNVAVRRDSLGRKTRYFYDLSDRLVRLLRPDGTEFNYVYNAAGQKISQADPLGRVTRFEYTPVGLLSKTIYPDGAEETFTYDTESRLTSKTNELGHTTNYEHDPMGRLLATIDPTGARWESQYDAAGRKIADKDPLGRVTTYQLDNLDRITKTVRPDSSFTINSFDAAGNLLSTVDALGNQWGFIYNNLNQMVCAVQPNGASSTITFDAAGQVIAETDALGRTVQYQYDNGGRRAVTIDALGNVWRNFYDAAGRLEAVQDPLGAVSSMTYDLMDRVVSQADVLGNMTSFEFDAAGRGVAKTDPESRRSITVYDQRDRVICEVDPEGYTVQYGYNLAGQRVSLTDGANRTWRWEHDPLNRVIAEIDPLGNTNRYAFDSVGNRISWTNARNQTIAYIFDSMNRLSQISYPDGTLATMSYDLEGRELSRSSPSGTVSKTWNAVGKMTSETFEPWGKKWQYVFDLVGNRVSAIDPEGQVFKYGFDNLNRLVSLDPPDKGDEIKYLFDAAGRPIGETRPGVKTTNTYDAAGRLLEMKHERNHGKEKIVALRRYTYSPVGNRLSMQDENNSLTRYFYNGSDWLTRVSYPDAQEVSYGYNGAGDRTEEKIQIPMVKGHGRNKVIGTDTVVIPMTYDAGGRLISRASDTFAFDPDGNQVTAVENGDETRYFWGADNRLVKVERVIECPKHGKKRCRQCPQTITLSESYTYEPNNWRRLTRKTGEDLFLSAFDGNDESHEYLVKTRWDKDEEDERRKCSAKDRDKPRLKLVRQFIGGPGTDDLELTRYRGRKLWTLRDGIGSTIALINRGGHAVARIGYDVWGSFRWPDKPGHGVKPCRDDDLGGLLDRLDGGRTFEFSHDGHLYGRHFGSLLNPFTFQGRRWDSFSKTFNHRNRQYNPKYGRWLNSDPSRFDGGLNLFVFCNNNPANLVDPMGLQWVHVWEKPYDPGVDGETGYGPIDYIYYFRDRHQYGTWDEERVTRTKTRPKFVPSSGRYETRYAIEGENWVYDNYNLASIWYKPNVQCLIEENGLKKGLAMAGYDARNYLFDSSVNVFPRYYYLKSVVDFSYYAGAPILLEFPSPLPHVSDLLWPTAAAAENERGFKDFGFLYNRAKLGRLLGAEVKP